jgi:fatty-acyl-CoA synthase
MTEAGTILGMPASPGRIEQKAGSAGLMPPTMERRIVDPSGGDCAPGEVGELALRGPNVFSGYWRRPDETAAAFTDDGFFLTGDLVRQDQDGFYFLVDRKKDMFISGGENVYPAEVEVALKSHPDVVEAAVVGTPDDRWGEVGHAFVRLRADASIDGETLVRYCEQHLARYKLPRQVHILAELPTTGSGKVIKSELKKRLREQDGYDA